MSVINIKEDVIGTDAILRRFPDISPRQMYYWTSRGWITPRDLKTGSGTPMLYTREQVTRIQYMSLLVNKLGLNPQSASTLIDSVFKNGRPTDGHIYYEADGFILALPIAEDQNGA